MDRDRQLAVVRRGHRRRLTPVHCHGGVPVILVWILVILLGGGFAAAIAARWSPLLCRLIAIATVLLDLALALIVWVRNDRGQVDVPWMPQFGIHFHLAVDGLSIL